MREESFTGFHNRQQKDLLEGKNSKGMKTKMFSLISLQELTSLVKVHVVRRLWINLRSEPLLYEFVPPCLFQPYETIKTQLKWVKVKTTES